MLIRLLALALSARFVAMLWEGLSAISEAQHGNHLPPAKLRMDDPDYPRQWVRAVRSGAPVQLLHPDGGILRELRPQPGRFHTARRLLLAGLGRWLYPRPRPHEISDGPR